MDQMSVKTTPRKGCSGGIILLQLIVINHLALHPCTLTSSIFPGTQTLLHQDLEGSMGRTPTSDERIKLIIVRNHVAGRPKAVPVKGRHPSRSAAEKDGGRAVQGSNHGGIILVEILFVCRDMVLLFAQGSGMVIITARRQIDHRS